MGSGLRPSAEAEIVLPWLDMTLVACTASPYSHTRGTAWATVPWREAPNATWLASRASARVGSLFLSEAE